MKGEEECAANAQTPSLEQLLAPHMICWTAQLEPEGKLAER